MDLEQEAASLGESCITLTNAAVRWSLDPGILTILECDSQGDKAVRSLPQARCGGDEALMSLVHWWWWEGQAEPIHRLKKSPSYGQLRASSTISICSGIFGRYRWMSNGSDASHHS